MKKLAIIGALLLVAASAQAKDKTAPKGARPDAPGLRYVQLVNSAGVAGLEEQAPFFTVPQIVHLSDTTSADTMITSSFVWIEQPLFRIGKEHDSRLDVEGPATVTCVSMAPFHREGLGFGMTYRMQSHIDDGPPASMLIATRRANPIYTTRLPGWTFGLPQGMEVQVPEGKHSVYFKVLEGEFDFCYCVFTVGRLPKEIPADPKAAASK